jgi:N-acetylmuramoyl-L-alanine amidase
MIKVNILKSKESVGRVVLAVSLSVTVQFGVMLYDSNERLKETGVQLGEAQERVEQQQSDYEKLENKFLSVESESQKLSNKQKELKSHIDKLKKENSDLQKQLKKKTESKPVKVSAKSPAKEVVDYDKGGNVVEVSNHNLIAQLVTAEAKGESFAGKVAVAEVIINRVESDEFPNTVSGVVYQTNQFSPVADGSINNAPTQESKEALQVALKGTDKTNGALFFYNPETATQRWLDSRPTTAVIGNHVFKK